MKNIQQDKHSESTSLAHVYDINCKKLDYLNLTLNNAVSPDFNTTTMLSNSITKDVKFKHFLFDIEMFAHVNVNKSSCRNALTTNDKLTNKFL